MKLLKTVINRAKQLLPETLKARIKTIPLTADDPRWIFNGSEKTVYVFLAGFYQNLGDMAITYAQVEFLSSLFPHAEIVTVPSTETYAAVKTIKKHIRPNDLVTIAGGGNMDDLYPSLENARLHIVRSFPNHRIISFPQTIHFSNSRLGSKSLKKSKRVYCGHRLLTIFAREPDSLERLKQYFPSVDHKLSPDIVLSLDRFAPTSERSGILCCLRRDKEQSLAGGTREKLLELVRSKFQDVVEKDTVDVSLTECDAEHYAETLNGFLALLRSCKGVLTDRLHCMIFCAITGTPCLVMDNSNHKIKGVYDAWLKDIPYLVFEDIQRPEAVCRDLASLLQTDHVPQKPQLSSAFAPLRDALLS